ncbi:hypothetical protein V7x_00510 [Crateriforma conspicua]|uniref:Uncharacterized protein n=1 Tax=Crateriforma conspicua TaxID=2527996 RepID=A0A5C5XSI4_9PLAN|nr:hypothetical protein Mal65_52800 [Crateriforma conspicua]TWT65491.1 hypothetical protein Pan14r_50370 [Crateriforma conspicua]TWU64508.1 hypothetical protein V7x_00510 [Crateriforma conspicua]
MATAAFQFARVGRPGFHLFSIIFRSGAGFLTRRCDRLAPGLTVGSECPA